MPGKTGLRFDAWMAAVTFAEAGEREIALEILREADRTLASPPFKPAAAQAPTNLPCR